MGDASFRNLDAAQGSTNIAQEGLLACIAIIPGSVLCPEVFMIDMLWQWLYQRAEAACCFQFCTTDKMLRGHRVRDNSR